MNAIMSELDTISLLVVMFEFTKAFMYPRNTGSMKAFKQSPGDKVRTSRSRLTPIFLFTFRRTVGTSSRALSSSRLSTPSMEMNTSGRLDPVRYVHWRAASWRLFVPPCCESSSLSSSSLSSSLLVPLTYALRLESLSIMLLSTSTPIPPMRRSSSIVVSFRNTIVKNEWDQCATSSIVIVPKNSELLMSQDCNNVPPRRSTAKLACTPIHDFTTDVLYGNDERSVRHSEQAMQIKVITSVSTWCSSY